ncbi:6,7-dimethyl-8-ribityllumazine synthase [Buchnera aphidicola]
MQTIECGLTNKKSKIVIIISRFNEFINNNLLSGAINTLVRIGNIKKHNITIIKVPGAYEIPIIANIISNSLKYQGIITLGTIIKGETIHFEQISANIISQLSSISIKYNIPIALGILITETIEQAINRAGVKLGNKGTEAALAILEMISIIKFIQKNNNLFN